MVGIQALLQAPLCYMPMVEVGTPAGRWGLPMHHTQVVVVVVEVVVTLVVKGLLLLESSSQPPAPLVSTLALSVAYLAPMVEWVLLTLGLEQQALTAL